MMTVDGYEATKFRDIEVGALFRSQVSSSTVYMKTEPCKWTDDEDMEYTRNCVCIDDGMFHQFEQNDGVFPVRGYLTTVAL